MTTAYSDVSWNIAEEGSREKLNQMSANIRFILDRSPKTTYVVAGVTRTTNMKLLCGMTKVEATGDSSFIKDIYFPGGIFTVGTNPVVVVSWANAVHPRISLSTGAIGGASAFADSRGFRLAAALNTDIKNYLNNTSYVSYIAMGI